MYTCILFCFFFRKKKPDLYSGIYRRLALCSVAWKCQNWILHEKTLRPSTPNFCLRSIWGENRAFWALTKFQKSWFSLKISGFHWKSMDFIDFGDFSWFFMIFAARLGTHTLLFQSMFYGRMPTSSISLRETLTGDGVYRSHKRQEWTSWTC